MLCGEALALLIGAALASGASPAQLAAQSEALRRIENVRVVYDQRQMPRYILGRTRFSISPDLNLARDRAKLEEIRREIYALFLGERTESLDVAKLETNPGRGMMLVFREAIAGIPVYRSAITLTTDRSHRIVSIRGDFVADRGLPREAMISAGRAAETALGRFPHAGSDATVGEPPALHYYLHPSELHPRPVRLVWVVRVNVKPGMPLVPVIIDAIDGSVVAVGDRTDDLNLNARYFGPSRGAGGSASGDVARRSGSLHLRGLYGSPVSIACTTCSMRRTFASESTMRRKFVQGIAARCACCGMSGRRIGTRCAAGMLFTGITRVTYSPGSCAVSAETSGKGA